MIHHLSIAACNPEHAANVLAECMDGITIPFPPNPGSYFALALDEHGTGVEVYPAGTEMQPNGIDGSSFIKNPPAANGYGATHFALSVALEADQIEAIARREGWKCYRCSRGGFFDVMELWIENAVLVELLPPSFAAQYKAFARAENIEKFLTARPH